MLSLEQRRSNLQQELDSLVQQLDSLKKNLFNDSLSPAKPAAPTSAPTRKGAPKRAKRGALKAKITAALESAGSLGVKVKDLAAALGTKPVNVHSWFHSALKRGSGITKLSGGHYRLAGSSAGVKAAPAAKPAKKARKGAKRGQLTADILSALKAAGTKGVTVSDLASKLGANYKNIYIWFATTGKKHPVKKLAPATYGLS
jgi:transposase-like protein